MLALCMSVLQQQIQTLQQTVFSSSSCVLIMEEPSRSHVVCRGASDIATVTLSSSLFWRRILTSTSDTIAQLSIHHSHICHKYIVLRLPFVTKGRRRVQVSSTLLDTVHVYNDLNESMKYDYIFQKAQVALQTLNNVLLFLWETQYEPSGTPAQASVQCFQCHIKCNVL